MACQKKPELASLITLRNTFSHAFETAKTTEELEDLLRNWIKQASPISQLDAFVQTLRRWLTPIKNFAFERLTNAATEGLNNLIRYVKRMSFGIPNFDHMRSRVLACSIT